MSRDNDRFDEDEAVWPTVLFLLSAVLLLSAVYVVWRYWDNLSRRTPEEEAFDERVAALNRRQANRISDEDLTHPLTEDEAWQVMISRGQRGGRRRERYSGDLTRRLGERRRRS
jgi:hypothetical protein